MSGVRRRDVALVLLAVAVPLAYFAGGVSGFGKGFAASEFLQSANAKPVVVTLRALRAGDTAVALNMLEVQLDSLVVQNSVGRKSFSSLFNLPGLVGVSSPVVVDREAGSAVKYRAEYPSPAQGAVKQAVDSALKELAGRVRE